MVEKLIFFKLNETYGEEEKRKEGVDPLHWNHSERKQGSNDRMEGTAIRIFHATSTDDTKEKLGSGDRRGRSESRRLIGSSDSRRAPARVNRLVTKPLNIINTVDGAVV